MSAPLTIKSKVPLLFSLLRWLEKITPPKMMLSFAGSGQIKTSITVPQSKTLQEVEEGWNYRPTIVRVTRRDRRGQRGR